MARARAVARADPAPRAPRRGTVIDSGAQIAQLCDRPVGNPTNTKASGIDVDATTIPQLEELMSSHRLNAVALMNFYFQRIRKLNSTLNAVITVSPTALADARAADAARRSVYHRPLLGISDHRQGQHRHHGDADHRRLLGARRERAGGCVVLLGAATGVDPNDPATAAQAGHASSDYTRFLDDQALRGARIGVWRAGTYDPALVGPVVEPILSKVIGALRAEGCAI